MKPGIIITLAVAAMVTGPASAQTDSNHQHSSPTESKNDARELAEELEELRDKVQHLEFQIQSGNIADSNSGMNMSNSQPGSMEMMGMKGGMKGMGTMKMGGKGKMSGNSDSMANMNGPGTPSGSKGMMSGMGNMMMSGNSGSMSGMSGMGMMGMGKDMMGMMKNKQGMSGMAMQSALPGFPGASHLYHIGATGFFLDHPQHITLTTAQHTKLNQIKEKAILSQATADRKIDEAEQQLWELTATPEPDAKKIETKIREIERLRGDQRMSFIRSVGEAAQALTHEQHQQLTGAAENKTADSTSNHQH